MSIMVDFSHQIFLGEDLLECWVVEDCLFNAGEQATVYNA